MKLCAVTSVSTVMKHAARCHCESVVWWKSMAEISKAQGKRKVLQL